jgi:7-carboxy-7-deazaguanine synthase
MSADLSVRITEIFCSIQGEAITVGLPTVFVRLTGCPLRCNYCDTAYAFQGGQVETFSVILSKVAAFNTRHITVTGGEPLAQKGCYALLSLLCDQGYQVSLETSGALPIELVDARVSIVMDIKTPSSGEVQRNLWDNLQHIKKTDQIKCVIADRRDYDWVRFQIDHHQLTKRVDHLLFSPSHDVLSARDLAEWILADQLPVRLQIQLHKYLWGNAQGR